MPTVATTTPSSTERATCATPATWQTNLFFKIIAKNMFNRKQPRRSTCAGHPDGNAPHIGNDHSFIYPVKWLNFVPNIGTHIDIASEIRDSLENYNLFKLPSC